MTSERALAGIVGDEHVETIRSSTIVVRPGTVAEVGEVVAVASKEKLRVHPAGAGSRRPCAPAAADVIVELRRLDRVVEHVPEDLVASIECGASLAACQRTLREHGQWLPLDPPATDGSTLGGTLAADAFGPRRLRHGRARDWVIGTTTVRPDGTLARAGGMVVKNVSGYDLSKLYLGSWGSLGILVRANVKLAPLPPVAGLLPVEVPDAAVAWSAYTRAAEGRLPLDTAVLLRGRWPSSGPGDATGLLRPENPRHGLLLFGMEGLRDVVSPAVERLRSAARDALSDSSLPAAAQTVGRWHEERVADSIREGLAHLGRLPGALAAIRLAYPPAEYPGVIREAWHALRHDDTSELSLLGSGCTWLSWIEPPPPQELVDRVERLRTVCERVGGWLGIERWPADVPLTIPRYKIDAPARKLMAALKSALDPDGTFVSPPWVST